ncbi:putative bifunctional diguanylate cyclase/phosphodiesterase [Ureibacillus composti]
MITFPTEETEKYLHDLMTLNPFDAVIVLKKQSNPDYTVELINPIAEAISPGEFIKGIDAKEYFKWTKWEDILAIMNEPNHEIQYIDIKNLEQVQINVQPIASSSGLYYVIVLRALNNEYQSIHNYTFEDVLTGLPNRSALTIQWTEKYSIELKESNVALLLIDLDRFKKYNESLGKRKADKMLKQISLRFHSLTNESYHLFHYHGDEFIFMVPFQNKEEIDEIVNALLNLLKEPFLIDDQEYFVTSSIGIAVTEKDRDLEELLHEAEQALFYVKKHGRAHYRFYNEEMSHTFHNEVLMEAHLRRAIELNELSIHLQPQVDFNTKDINSFEALLRWNNPKFGNVSPGVFIPLAESSGLIIQIGDWVLEEVCKYQRDWKLNGFRPVRIAVNISPKQFKQDDFVIKVEKVLDRYKINPKYIELEITESSMVNVDETEGILNRLKALGVYVSVDDFGTGYSSLSYLKKYPIDIIKIDQSFIADINKDEKNEAIIKAIITLSKNLGMDVIAEGVEYTDQEQFLKQFNCHKGQGYLYNKPIPVEKIVEQYFML